MATVIRLLKKHDFGQLGAISAMTPNEGKKHFNSMVVESWALGSCSIASLSGFNKGASFYSSPYEFFGDLYKAHTMDASPYYSWNILYLLSDAQSKINPLHAWMLECGSKEIDVFDNQAHDSKPCHIFRFNLKGAIGKYIDENGIALKPKEPENVQEPDNTATTKPTPIKAPKKQEPIINTTITFTA